MNKTTGKILFIIALVILFSYFLFPLDKKIKKGLDLQGGVHLVLEVEVPPDQKKTAADIADRAMEIIRNRVDGLGVAEPVIQKEGIDRIIIDLPGIDNPDRALEIIGKTALLEFRLVSDDADLNKQAQEGKIPEGYELLSMKEKDERGITRESSPLLVKKDPELTGAYLEDAFVGYDQSGFPDVSISFNNEGAKKFEETTRLNVKKRLAIILDGVIQSAPVINERIPSGKAQISGHFDVETAKELALVLRAGALPAKVNIIYRQIVGPTLGKVYVKQGFTASLAGGTFVLLFMVVYYQWFGLLANAAMAMNVLFLLGILAGFRFSLTLPGIAGIALTCGMAVDANVLIFERIREELRNGRSPRTAIDAGYEHAWSAIVDSNLTTVIAGLALFFLGEGSIKGFGLTLVLGNVLNLFTAIFVTRSVIEWVLYNRKLDTLRI